jgi:hypothetical protein
MVLKILMYLYKLLNYSIMYKKNTIKITLVILISIILILSSSMLFLGQSQNSGNSGVSAAPFVSGSYNVTFNETGLTSGTQWNVVLNGTSENLTASSIIFTELNGTYPYTVGNISGFSVTAVSSPSPVIVNGSSITVNVTFTKLASVSISPVNLGTAGDFTILAKTGISNTGTSSIVGNIGVSPASSTYITGLSLILSSSGQFATSSMVTGNVYAATYASPTPSTMTTAVSDMQTAYTDAAGRTNPNYINLGAGNLNGMTLVPGLYKWGTGVSISTSITLTGNASSVWIFQIAGGLTFGNGAQIILSGGAQPQNIFWQVASGATIGTGASFYGTVLSQTAITIATGSSMTGLALAQTAVTLQSDKITASSEPQNITAAMYGVTFTEVGLPSGTQWNVTLNGVLLSSTVPTISFSEPNGTYAFTVVSSTADKIFPSTGNIIVNGEIAYQGITFAAPNQTTYTVAFNESGLPSGAQWGVTLDGITTTSGSSFVNFTMTNGSYPFAIIVPADYSATPSTGTEPVNGNNTTVLVTIVLVVYPVTFTETGLPSGTTWYLNITSMTSSGPLTGSTYTVNLDNNSYSYTSSSTDSAYHAVNGTFAVNGHSTSQTANFSKVSTPTPTPKPSSNTDIYIIAGIVVALAVIGTAVALMLRKRGTK